MVRISGVDLPRNRRIEIGLTYIFGIGLTSSKQILAETGISPDTRCINLTDEGFGARSSSPCRFTCSWTTNTNKCPYP